MADITPAWIREMADESDWNGMGLQRVVDLRAAANRLEWLEEAHRQHTEVWARFETITPPKGWINIEGEHWPETVDRMARHIDTLQADIIAAADRLEALEASDREKTEWIRQWGVTVHMQRQVCLECNGPTDLPPQSDYHADTCQRGRLLKED